MTRALTVVLHDVAPATWPAVERLRRCVRSVAPVPVTQLVVPRYHGQPHSGAFDRWLDESLGTGDELALHGYTHQDDAAPPSSSIDRLRRRWYTAGEGEFAALDTEEALRRLRAGRQWFERRRWPLYGFVAPAWLMSEGTWSALRDEHFHYTCTLASVVDLTAGVRLHSQSLVWSTRSAWRRGMSRPWNAAVEMLERRRPLLRFELHPGDVEHGAIRASWMRMLERALEDHEPLTMAQAADSARRNSGASFSTATPAPHWR